MQLIVNGNHHEHHGDGTLKSLLEEIGATSHHFLLIVNDELIRWSRGDCLSLTEGDRIEVITIGAGG